MSEKGGKLYERKFALDLCWNRSVGVDFIHEVTDISDQVWIRYLPLFFQPF